MKKRSQFDLRLFLNEKHDAFNQVDFIAPDPISIPHRFQKKEDIEIAGLLSALIAWGKRNLIVRGGERMMELMREAPFSFVMEAGEDDLARLDGFVYRTFQAVDFRGVVLGLRRIYREKGGLEQVMALLPADKDTSRGIVALRNAMLATPEFPARTQKHFANPERGSSAKRLNMFLRWMVRKDGRGVDFGIWNNMRPAQLVCPLDVHTGNVGRKLGLIQRKGNNWKAALELTNGLRTLDPTDPVKYDFALFGLGIFEGF
ncbi:MAG TPA: TIGR02757 family protein [Bacteroidetes bacterium]|nr:TIGR02757 family protein [Bacteroidota bacterium]